MSTQNERSAKAQIIWNSTDSNSITPTMVGSLFYDINVEKLERDNSNAVYQTYDASYTKVAAINPTTKKMTLIDIPNGIGDLSNYYTKNETNLLLENYYIKTETYSQNEIDSLFLNETLDTITDRGNNTENPITVGSVQSDFVQLDTTAINTYDVGKFYWNETKGTYDFGLKNNVTLQLGQEQHVYGKAYSAITNGQLVMYRTSQGGHILFEPANFTQLSSNPDLIIGVATQDIALNDFGYITTFGEVNTLNTSSFADGNTLYFGSGNVLQNTIPTGSYFIVGRVNRSHATQGSIFVKPYFVDTTKISGSGTANYIPKFTASGTVANSKIFDNGTNVGIGTTSPNEKLTVFGKGFFKPIVIPSVLGGQASPYYGTNITLGADQGSAQSAIRIWGAYSSGTNAATIFERAINTQSYGSDPQTLTYAESMRISGNGNVGIGTTSPSYPLHVATQVSNISIYATYDIVAYSDISVKTNIRPIDNVLERINNSRGVLYDRVDSGEKNNIGFIAQELEEQFPELVVENLDGTKAVKYQNAVAILFEAIKEQQKQINELEHLVKTSATSSKL